MALSTTVSKVVLAGNSATTVWPYTFPIPDAASLQVTFTDAAGVQTLLSASQFSVTGLGTTTGGNVTYPLAGSPIATGTKITIARVVDYTQSTVFTNQGGYFPQVTESRFDRVMMAVQQLADSVRRALVAPISDSNVGTLPSATQRANTFLGFDASGNPIAVLLSTTILSVSNFIQTNLLPAASAAAARSALGSVGAVNIQKFTASGTYTPTANMLYCIIECGGGGGGGGAVSGAPNLSVTGGGGGGGSYSRKIATAATIGASQVVTIGPGGAGGAAGANPGSAGTDTSVGALCIGKGGSGGAAGSGSSLIGAGGVGGVAGTGDETIPGGAGGAGNYQNNSTGGNVPSGYGGASRFGGGGSAVGSLVSIAGSTPAGFGGGGSGGFAAGNVTVAGAAGAPGYVVVTEFLAS